MSTTSDQPLIPKLVEDLSARQERLQAAYDEYMEIEDAKARLLGTAPTASAPARGRGRSTSTASGSTGTRRSGVNRQEQLLKIVTDHPDGISVPDVAVAMTEMDRAADPGAKEVQSNYVYRVRDKAKAAGQIAVADDGKLLPARVAELAAR